MAQKRDRSRIPHLSGMSGPFLCEQVLLQMRISFLLIHALSNADTMIAGKLEGTSMPKKMFLS